MAPHTLPCVAKSLSWAYFACRRPVVFCANFNCYRLHAGATSRAARAVLPCRANRHPKSTNKKPTRWDTQPYSTMSANRPTELTVIASSTVRSKRQLRVGVTGSLFVQAISLIITRRVQKASAKCVRFTQFVARGTTKAAPTAASFGSALTRIDTNLA